MPTAATYGDADASVRPGPTRLLLLAVLAVFLLQAAGFHGFRQDDAFITYVYGRNLASGEGLVFNPGERLMGSTSPLHALLSAAVYPLAGDGPLPDVMAIIGCVGWTLQAVLAFLLLRAPLGRWPALLVALALAAGAAGSHQWVTLETNLVAALALGAVVAGVTGRWTLAAGLLALAGLTRPDAYLLGLPLGLLALGDLRRGAVRPGPPLVAFALPTVPWYLFAALYYGTVLPQSLAAKVGKEGVGFYLYHLLTRPARQLMLGHAHPLWIVTAWLLAVGGAVVLVRRRPRLWVLPAWGLLHLAAYLALRPFHQHQWHLYPLVLVFVLCALAALGAVARFQPRRVALTVALAALGAMVAAHAAESVEWMLKWRNGYWYGDRQRAYVRTAEYLRRHGDPQHDVVASVEVGTLAYYSGFTMYDLGGIVTRLPGPGDPLPELDWFVTDPTYLSWAPEGQAPETIVRADDFLVFVFRLGQTPGAVQATPPPRRAPPPVRRD